MEAQTSLGVLGCGNMASALLHKGENDIRVLNSTNESTQHAAQKIGAQSAKNIDEILSRDLLMLGVKPQHLGEILQDTEIMHPILSLLAMTTCDKIHKTLGTEASITRIMPTMGSMVDRGLTAVYFEQNVSQEIRDAVREIAFSTGKIIELDDEKSMEAFTIHSSSMLAIMALIKEEIEKHIFDEKQRQEVLDFVNEFLVTTAQKSGLQEAEMITQQTWDGLFALLDAGYSTEKIVELVASKGGTTEAMLEYLKDEPGVFEAFAHYPDIYEVHQKFFSVLREAIDMGLKKAGF